MDVVDLPDNIFYIQEDPLKLVEPPSHSQNMEKLWSGYYYVATDFDKNKPWSS